MALREPRSINKDTIIAFQGELTVPDASKYTIALDTTQELPGRDIAVAPGKSATIPTVGAKRGMALGRQYGLSFSCTGQNVTVLQYLLNGAGAWTLFASTEITAAAADQSFAWDPSAYGASDCLVLVLGGATPPTKIYFTLTERVL